MDKTIAIASDHAGLELKREVIAAFTAKGYAFEDLGTDSAESVDYPDYANALSAWVMQEEGRRGILICGSGIGMSIAANRHKGIRAALCHHSLEASLTRRHNDANVLCLGARIIGSETALDCIHTFLTTEFEGGRHERRVEKLAGALLPHDE